MTKVDPLRARARRLLETIWEGYWDEWHETAILAAFEDVTRDERRAREAAEQALRELADRSDQWLLRADDMRLQRGQQTRVKAGHEGDSTP